MFLRFCNYAVRFWFPSEGSVNCLCESRKVGLMKTPRFALYIGNSSLPITPPANQNSGKSIRLEFHMADSFTLNILCRGKRCVNSSFLDFCDV